MAKNQKHVNQSILIPPIRKTALALALSQALGFSVSMGQAATITVTTTSGEAGGSDCTLRDAITAANFDTAVGGCSAGTGEDAIILPANATITLTTPDNCNIAAECNGLPIVTSSITIEGNETTLLRDSNSQKFRIFELNQGLLTLRNTTVSGGGRIYGGTGGAIYAHHSSSVTLVDSIVSRNFGGIKAESSSVALINSRVSGNRGRDSDYYIATSGILVLNGSATLTNSRISNNKGSGGIKAISSTVTLTNSTVSGNEGYFNSGISAFSGSITLINSTVSNNISYNSAGISSFNNTLTLINSTVSGNRHKYPGAVGVGGITSAGNLVLINSTITKNRPGGIEIIASNPTEFIFKNSIIANNLHGDCSNNTNLTPVIKNTLIGDGGINCGTSLLTGDPKLEPLRKNGGPTETHALSKDSPAIDAGDDTICTALPKNVRNQPTDQRGRSRTGPAAGLHCDIGAYEFRRQRRK